MSITVSGITPGISADAAFLQTKALAGGAKSEGAFQAALDSAMETKDKAKLKKACVDFEGYFIQMMLKEMRKSVDTQDGILPKSQATQIFEGMLDEEAAKSAASGQGIGLADMMYRQLEKTI